MGIDNGIGSETMGALARLDATLILRDLTRGAGSFGGRTGGGGVPGGVSSSSSSCCSPSFFTRKVSALVEPELFSPPDTFFESQPSPLLHRLFH